MKKLLIIGAAVAVAAYTPVAMAAISYSYENDNKTLVATVTDADATLTTSAADQAWFTSDLTNFVKRGTKTLNVWENVANSFTGDIRVEDTGNLLFYGNALGVNRAQGEIQIHRGHIVVNANGRTVTFAKNVAFGFGGEWNDKIFEVWNDKTSIISGKVTTGNRNAMVLVYKNASLSLTGGVEDPAADTAGYFYIGAHNAGAKVTFSGKPVVVKYPIYFPFQNYHVNNTDDYRDASGYIGHITFSVAGNKMKALGYDNGSTNARLRYHELKTTVDWAFDKPDMMTYLGEEAKWDLCGTTQRVGQFNVRVPDGRSPSIVTNSSATPAKLYMGQIFNYTNGSLPPDIRFGGDLSVEFIGNIWTTRVDHVMTAAGNLTIAGNGNRASELWFLENGSWANATNVTVNGNGKMKIANPNALGKRANLSLASNSSLEIASGVTVQVRTLTVGGVQKPNGDYTFGSGTLRVFKPGTRLIIR